jgi:hypothetical protein
VGQRKLEERLQADEVVVFFFVEIIVQFRFELEFDLRAVEQKLRQQMVG